MTDDKVDGAFCRCTTKEEDMSLIVELRALRSNEADFETFVVDMAPGLSFGTKAGALLKTEAMRIQIRQGCHNELVFGVTPTNGSEFGVAWKTSISQDELSRAVEVRETRSWKAKNVVDLKETKNAFGGDSHTEHTTALLQQATIILKDLVKSRQIKTEVFG